MYPVFRAFFWRCPSGPAGELGDFVFAAMVPADVSAANLAPFDTAVLNVASVGMACNTNTLSAAQQADLVAVVSEKTTKGAGLRMQRGHRCLSVREARN